MILAIIPTGALLTTLRQLGPSASGSAAAWLGIHEGAGFAAVAAALLSIGIARADSIRAFAPLAWLSLALLVLMAAIGWGAREVPSLAVVHACLAPLSLGALTAAVVAPSMGASASGSRRADISPTVVRLARLAPAAVVVQVVLGAAYRHALLGVLPHMAGAAVVLIVMLTPSTRILQVASPPPAARVAAMLAMTVVLTQLTLGIATFVIQLLGFTQTGVWLWVTALHVTVGAGTLAASIVLARSLSPEP